MAAEAEATREARAKVGMKRFFILIRLASRQSNQGG